MMRCVPSSTWALTMGWALALLSLAAAALGCTDPVEEVSAPAASSATREDDSASSPSPSERTSAAAEGDEPRTNDEDDQDDDAAPEPEAVAEALAADVAAGLVDGGPPPDVAPLEGEPAAAATAGLPASEQGPYVRPEIHPSPIEGFQIIRFALAQDVIDREPVMISSSFQRDGGPMHVFLEARNTTGADVTLLVGFRPASSDVRGGGVSLTIPPSPRYRTRARGNTRRPAGEWICEVMDDRQRVLVTQRFRITPAPPAAAP